METTLLTSRAQPGPRAKSFEISRTSKEDGAGSH